MPGRKYQAGSGSYRYGFNGKENDNDVKGEGNQQDYGFRIYDPRLSKFLSVDPLAAKYPMLTPYQFAGNMPTKFIDLDGAEPANNPTSPGTKEKVAMATVETIFYKTSENSFKKNLFNSGIWKAADIEGTYSCGPKVLKGAQSTENGAYVTDNTDIGPANKLNMFVSSANTFNVNESNAKKFDDYEAFVVGQLMNNFISGQGPENYNFPTNGIISSKFFESDIFKKAVDEYNGGILKPNETKQYNFGVMDLFKDAVRNWTPFNITGMTGSGTIIMTPTEKGVLVKIFNITSLSSGALIKNPSDPSTYPKSYVRDPTQATPYGNISQTFNLFIPKESSLIKKKGS